MVSFFIDEKRLLVFDMLKYVTRCWGEKFMWFVSIGSIVWGIFIIVAPLLFDIPVQKGRCYF